MKLNKLAAAAIGASMALGIAVPAFAAATVTNLVVDGGTSTSVEEGSTVEAQITFDVTASTDVESVSWELVGSDLPKKCVNISNTIADGTFTRTFDIDTTGATEGSWDVRIALYGDDGASASNLCEESDQIGSLTTFGDRITVTDDNNDNQDNNTGTSGNQSQFEKLQAQFAALMLFLKGNNGTGTTPAPATGKCAELSMKLAGTQQSTYTAANTRLQGFLLSEGATIPALAAGASFGYYGPQTMAAVSWFNSVNNCR